jgi:hypothetical protein
MTFALHANTTEVRQRQRVAEDERAAATRRKLRAGIKFDTREAEKITAERFRRGIVGSREPGSILLENAQSTTSGPAADQERRVNF